MEGVPTGGAAVTAAQGVKLVAIDDASPSMDPPTPTEASGGSITVNSEHDEVLTSAEKKVNVVTLTKFLSYVGVSTTSKGSSLVAEESRSKQTQLKNAAVVATLLERMAYGGGCSEGVCP